MTISMYEASIPVFIHTLGTLRGLLEKGAAHAEARKFDPSVLVNSRIAPDMFPLARQVQIASDSAKGAAARLSGTEAPKFEDTEKTIPELIARIDKTIDYLKGFKPAQIDGSEDRQILLKFPQLELTLSGLAFLRQWAMPNFFFHVTTTYNLLRHNGVDIGKRDYLGQVSG